MDFDQLLDRTIEMLQRRRRLTYRTLKRQFDLDDETLEDLKFELIEGQQIAIHGRHHHDVSSVLRPSDSCDSNEYYHEWDTSLPKGCACRATL